MSVLAVGLSHRSAPIPFVSSVSLDGEHASKLLLDLLAAPHVEEAVVLSTCNRVEVHVEVSKFHAGLAEVSELLARAGGTSLDALTPYLYVHYEDQAVQHIFSVAAGLDSMIVGERQILGQVRTAYRSSRDADALGRVLDPLVQQALRVGKRVHAETGIDRAGASVVSAGLAELGPLAGCSAVVIGAGSMGALAASLLRRAGVGELVVLNRSAERAERVGVAYGGRGAGLDALPACLAAADVVVSVTGSAGPLVSAAQVAAATEGRTEPLRVLDLALPPDLEPSVRGLPGVRVVDLETLHDTVGAVAATSDVERARRIVTEEVGAYLASQLASRVAPTVVALRAKAAEVVAAELARLDGRLPGLGKREREEVAGAVRRVVDKLLHAPTVRVKELAGGPEGANYAAALRELFDLDPAAPDAVARADVSADEVLP